MCKSTYKLKIIKEVVLLISIRVYLKLLTFTYRKQKIMKTILSILVLMIVGVSSSFAQGTAKFEFKSEVIDYGDIDKGSDGVRTFQFKNVGSEPLIIENVYSSCGCTVPTWTKTAIAPGKSGEIQVKYDTSRIGPIRRTITIYSNTDEPVRAVKIKGRVLDPDEKS